MFYMKLLIFYLTDDRRHYTFQPFLHLLNSSLNKTLFKLLILTHTNDSDFYNNELKNISLNAEIINVDPNNNYLQKIFIANNYALENNIPYMMKCDNDIFITSQTLDFMIDNLDKLNDNHLTIGPILSNGIPTVEYFIDGFMDNENKTKLQNIFLETEFYNRDGASYLELNKHTIHSNSWDKFQFFNSVRNMNHHYKGVHPVRISNNSIKFINDYIIDNKERFFENKQFGIIDNNDSPYLCNSIYCIKTDVYHKIINDNSLYVDDFDEVPLNKYAWNNNMNHLFVENGFGIHITYNWHPGHINYEQEFCNKFYR